jgi:hypothetical protein
MDGAEFAEWQAYYNIEPFGELREDWRSAQVPYMLATMFGKKGKKVNFQDFMLQTEAQKPKQTYEQMESTLKSIALEFNKHGNNR